MKEDLKSLGWIALYVAIFFGLQVVCVGLFTVGIPHKIIATALGMLLSGVLTVFILTKAKWASFSLGILRENRYMIYLLMAIIALGNLIPTAYITELSGVDTDSEEIRLLNDLMKHPLGALAGGVVIPVAEEVLFRGAILGRLLRTCRNRWLAIVLSALAFGIAHGNMAQAPHAFALGLLLGWMACRTRSLWPGIVFHIVNNSSAVVLSLLFPESDEHVIEIFGGNEMLLYATLAVSVVVMIAAFFILKGKLDRVSE